MVWPKGKLRSPETRIKLSLANLGNKNAVGGKGGPGRKDKPPHKENCPCPFCRAERHELVGTSNPSWRGGPGSGFIPGWKTARKAVWERDKVCGACGKLPHPNRRLDVHHIVPRRNGGTNELSNLVGLHHGCHMLVEIGKMKLL